MPLGLVGFEYKEACISGAIRDAGFSLYAQTESGGSVVSLVLVAGIARGCGARLPKILPLQIYHFFYIPQARL